MKQAFYIIISVFVIAVSAHLNIDLSKEATGIPFSFQSLTIFISAAFLKPRNYTIAILLYFIFGAFGLPVFAEGSSGWDHFLGNSGGFLYGFLPAGLFVSFAFKDKSEPGIWFVLNTLIQGTLVLFFFGLIHLSVKFGPVRAFDYGFFPFWKMALLKAFLAAAIIVMIKRYQRH